MNFRLIQPTALLSMYIKHYWFLEMEACEAVGERVVPTGYVDNWMTCPHLKIKCRNLANAQSVTISGCGIANVRLVRDGLPFFLYFCDSFFIPSSAFRYRKVLYNVSIQ